MLKHSVHIDSRDEITTPTSVFCTPVNQSRYLRCRKRWETTCREDRRPNVFLFFYGRTDGSEVEVRVRGDEGSDRLRSSVLKRKYCTPVSLIRDFQSTTTTRRASDCTYS